MTTHVLKREISLLQATSINMIDMIGIGPFVVMPLVIGMMGSHLFLWAWIFGAATALIDGMIWSELGASYPLAGGSYNFLKGIIRAKMGKVNGIFICVANMLASPAGCGSGRNWFCAVQ